MYPLWHGVFVQPELTQNFACKVKNLQEMEDFWEKTLLQSIYMPLFFNHFSYFRKLPTWCCNPITEFSFFPIFLSNVKNVVLSNTIEFSEWKHMLIFLFQNCWSLCPPWQKTPLSLLISWHLLKIYWRPFLFKKKLHQCSLYNASSTWNEHSTVHVFPTRKHLKISIGNRFRS